ncbi:hypothetical protein BHM03_00027422 [Ensete ventricosum]|nr:hypothetical protein BHM03_00027422 [Ensete ventricosum]
MARVHSTDSGETQRARQTTRDLSRIVRGCTGRRHERGTGCVNPRRQEHMGQLPGASMTINDPRTDHGVDEVNQPYLGLTTRSDRSLGDDLSTRPPSLNRLNPKDPHGRPCALGTRPSHTDTQAMA